MVNNKHQSFNSNSFVGFPLKLLSQSMQAKTASFIYHLLIGDMNY